jgi:hypothetical protein
MAGGNVTVSHISRGVVHFVVQNIMQATVTSNKASLTVTSFATLTTNYVRRQRMFLLVPSAHAVGCQEGISPGEYRCMYIAQSH